MFHDTGTKLPPGVGTVAPEAVAEAVVRAIERNRGEIDVAPVSLRAGAMAAGLAPDLAATVSRRLGGPRIAEQHVAHAERQALGVDSERIVRGRAWHACARVARTHCDGTSTSASRRS